MAQARARGRPPMSAEHKQALARGREEGRAVRRYLEALEGQRPRRGRRRSPDAIRRRLEQVSDELTSAGSVERLHLYQEQKDLQAELSRMCPAGDLDVLEKAFVEVAKAYSLRKGISYGAWRAAGVPPTVLARAGINRAD